jgi:hypothetical protein
MIKRLEILSEMRFKVDSNGLFYGNEIFCGKFLKQKIGGKKSEE